MLRRILLAVLLLAVLAVAGFAIFVAARQNLTHDAPAPAIAAAADSAVIARGRYIVRGLAPCASCHGDPARTAERAQGLEVALSGGNRWDIPPGRFYAPNITSDSATGIGAIPDSLIARALRLGIRHDGRSLLPFMEFQGLSDEDLTAVISYLRTLPPTRNPVPAHRPSLLGNVVLATALSEPVGPAQPPPATSPRGATVENGRYLTESVALCGGCHTARNQMTGAFTGPHLGGAKEEMASEDDPGRRWSPPNLTRGGRLADFDEDAFVARMRAGAVYPDSPMPWWAYRNLAEEDLRAIYRYLASLPPVTNDVGPAFVDRR